MSDYISREDAICPIKHYLDNPPKNHSQLFISGMEDAYYRMLSNLNNLPSADVAPVVRCKYCRYRVDPDKCCHPDGLLRSKDSDFCSRGERKERKS